MGYIQPSLRLALCEIASSSLPALRWVSIQFHSASGWVTITEIEYARQDVRCTAALLNAAKEEFDLHPIAISPDKAFSPASIAKAYLDTMGIIPPAKKFKVPNKILG